MCVCVHIPKLDGDTSIDSIPLANEAMTIIIIKQGLKCTIECIQFVPCKVSCSRRTPLDLCTHRRSHGERIWGGEGIEQDRYCMHFYIMILCVLCACAFVYVCVHMHNYTVCLHMHNYTVCVHVGERGHTIVSTPKQ